MRPFVRILVGMWTAALLCVGLTYFLAATLLPAPPDGDDLGDDLGAVRAAARDLGDLQGRPLETVLRRHQNRPLRIFLIDADGADALGRRVPLLVLRALRRADPALMDDLDWTGRDPRLTVHGDTVSGYRLVGYRTDLRPVAEAISRPGGRLLLLVVGLIVTVGVSWVLARGGRRLTAAD